MDLVTLALAKKIASSSSGGSESLDDLYTKEFPELNTTSKTIVGSINEVLEKINALTPVDDESLLTVTAGETE